jgi:hypothetical protein
MYNTTTFTYTVTDIRKTFENFEADLRTIARRTAKWSMDDVDKVFHDIIALAEEEFVHSVDICLSDSIGSILRATKFVVNSAGTAISSDRAGGNDWTDIPNTKLLVIVAYSNKWLNLSVEQRVKFQNDKNFELTWVASTIDNTFPLLTQSQGQLYASKGYELRKTTYK